MSLQFKNSTTINDPHLVGYGRHVDAMIHVLRGAIEDNRVEYVLCFGMPGVGKTLFADQVAYQANSKWHLGCSALHFHCNEYVVSSDVTSIDDDLYRVTVLVEQQCPMVLSIDELDYIAMDRLAKIQDARYNRLALKVMGLLSSNFASRATPSGGLLVLLSTNTPLQLEPGVLDRVCGGIVYFPLPGRETSIEIIRDFGIGEPEQVYDRLAIMTSGAYFSGRGLFEASQRAVREHSSANFTTPDDAAKALFGCLPPLTQDQERVDTYHKTHERLIRQSQAFMERFISEG